MSDGKHYDTILIGTGSGLEIIRAIIQGNENARVAVIDKDEPGGICLTRGCIPSKILLYHAELIRNIQRSGEFGIEANLKGVSFPAVMRRMRALIGSDMAQIATMLAASKNIDYFRDVATFVGKKSLRVGHEIISSDLILLCTGSRPAIPTIEGLEKAGYLTSDTLLNLDHLPPKLVIIGGGYIAAEYGYFFAAMGSEVTIVGRNAQFLPECEPEIASFMMRELSRHLTIFTGHEVRAVETLPSGKLVTATDTVNGEVTTIPTDEILVATGRSPNTDLLHPEIAGVAVDDDGWIVVDKYRQTTQPGIWAFGDVSGLHLFKHMANYEAKVVYYNAVLKEQMEADDVIVPFAVFTYPETASVGLKEAEAISAFGKENIGIGLCLFEDTAKGLAMGIKGSFAKIIVELATMRILGGHIVGPEASVLIQEIITSVTTLHPARAFDISDSIHIHPSLSEVVDRACSNLMSVDEYHHIMEKHLKLLPAGVI